MTIIYGLPGEPNGMWVPAYRALQRRREHEQAAARQAAHRRAHQHAARERFFARQDATTARKNWYEFNSAFYRDERVPLSLATVPKGSTPKSWPSLHRHVFVYYFGWPPGRTP